ncbi:MAG: hypothetical protein HYX32_14070 [Actinobacteria bacterium]|nr:hypothetical protein [Actinomycetota bacterium]
MARAAEAALFAILGPAVPSVQQSALVAAIALYRYATWLLPIPLGAATYLYWRFSARWKATAAGSPAVASGLPG